MSGERETCDDCGLPLARGNEGHATEHRVCWRMYHSDTCQRVELHESRGALRAKLAASEAEVARLRGVNDLLAGQLQKAAHADVDALRALGDGERALALLNGVDGQYRSIEEAAAVTLAEREAARSEVETSHEAYDRLVSAVIGEPASAAYCFDTSEYEKQASDARSKALKLPRVQAELREARSEVHDLTNEVMHLRSVVRVALVKAGMLDPKGDLPIDRRERTRMLNDIFLDRWPAMLVNMQAAHVAAVAARDVEICHLRASSRSVVMMLLRMLALYPNYEVRSRGPVGCVHNALRELDLTVQHALAEGEDPHDLLKAMEATGEEDA